MSIDLSKNPEAAAAAKVMLGKADIAMFVDVSGSTGNRFSGTNRLQHGLKKFSEFAKQALTVDRNGIIALGAFDDHVYHFKDGNVVREGTPESGIFVDASSQLELDNFFGKLAPAGGTRTDLVITSVLDEFLKGRASGNTAPLRLLIQTDGETSDFKALVKAFMRVAQESKEGEFEVGILTVDRRTAALEKQLKELDDGITELALYYGLLDKKIYGKGKMQLRDCLSVDDIDAVPDLLTALALAEYD